MPEYQDDLVSSATTDITGSVVGGGDGVRDKDGFLIPQSPRSDDSHDVTEEEDATADEEDQTSEVEDNSIGTENSALSRDS